MVAALKGRLPIFESRLCLEWVIYQRIPSKMPADLGNFSQEHDEDRGNCVLFQLSFISNIRATRVAGGNVRKDQLLCCIIPLKPPTHLRALARQLPTSISSFAHVLLQGLFPRGQNTSYRTFRALSNSKAPTQKHEQAQASHKHGH